MDARACARGVLRSLGLAADRAAYRGGCGFCSDVAVAKQRRSYIVVCSASVERCIDLEREKPTGLPEGALALRGSAGASPARLQEPQRVSDQRRFQNGPRMAARKPHQSKRSRDGILVFGSRPFSERLEPCLTHPNNTSRGPGINVPCRVGAETGGGVSRTMARVTGSRTVSREVTCQSFVHQRFDRRQCPLSQYTSLPVGDCVLHHGWRNSLALHSVERMPAVLPPSSSTDGIGRLPGVEPSQLRQEAAAPAAALGASRLVPTAHPRPMRAAASATAQWTPAAASG